jgi:hypothetical protein
MAPLEQNWGLMGKDTHESAYNFIVFPASYPVIIGDTFRRG